MNNEQILEELTQFISNMQGIKPSKMNGESTLQGNLNIYGDDAVELMIAYGKRFNVDVSKFMAADYFSAEGGFSYFDSPSKQLTIYHMVAGVLSGKLDEGIINDSKRILNDYK